MHADDQALPSAEALYDHAPCALILTNKSGLILRANSTFCSWLGYSKEQLVGIRKLQELLTVGGRIFHQTHWMPLLEMQRSIAEVKLEFKRADGTTLPMMLNALRREHESGILDEVTAFVLVDRHRFEQEVLNAKRQAEEALQQHLVLQRELSVTDTRLRIALESAQLYIWDVDPVTMARRYDNSVAHLLGHASSQPVSEADFAGAIHEADRQQEGERFAAALGLLENEYRAIYRLNGIDGEQRTVLATGRGVFDPNRKLVQFVGVLHDISEVSRQQAAAEDRALFAEQMVGIVSHDLRNPLSVILMATQMLGRQDLSPKQQLFLRHAQDATHRAQRLINDLLDFTQARVGRGIAIIKTPLDLHATVAQSLEELRIVYADRTITHLSIGEGDCLADGDRLAQLIGNLVSNAMTYGDPGTPVTVTSALSAQRFELSVNNQGKPIADDLIAGLFNPMTRGVDVPQGARSVGLGLFIVSEIIKAHGGTVTVTSTVETGTTFQAVFPLS
jgi:sigma-B regulation protein RsbU (phosphoserine phosphatase)